MKKNTFFNLFKIEKDNLSLWFSVFFAIGIGIYFALPIEPSIYIGIILTALSLIAWIWGRKDPIAYFVIGYIFFMCFGFTCANVKTDIIRAPMLQGPLFDYPISGTVSESRLLLETQQVILKDVVIDGFSKSKTPKFVRINIANIKPIFKQGDQIKTYAHLMPPTEPVSIGAYNFAQTAYYNQLGAIGRATGDVILINRPNDKSFLEHVKHSILVRIKELLPTQSAGVVIPLIIGEQGTVSKDTYELYRKTGITHVLSVSGMHLTLIAGFVFFLIRGFLALFPFIALRINTKKVAAIVALAITFFYLLISGMAIPAVRSYIMIFVVLVAVLFNRNAISLRSVSIAALIILFLYPESLITASFQLSFMAVLALVSLYSVFMNYIRENDLSIVGKIGLLLAGVLCVNVLASVATAPYTIFHFNQLATYSVIGNLLTSGLFSFCVMPALLIGVILMPFGGDGIFITIAGKCLDIIYVACEWVVELPHASLILKNMSVTGITLISAGFLIIFLMKTRFRWIGILPIVGGFLTYCWVITPDVLVAEGGRVYAIKNNNDQLTLSNADNRFVTDVWLRQNGQDPDLYDYTNIFAPESIRIKGYKIAFTTWDCATADVTFIVGRAFGGCGGIVVERRDLYARKTHELYIINNTIQIKTVRDSLGQRPWNPDFMLAQDEKSFYDNPINEK